MKLLIITQKVNLEDPILGFFHRWIIEFAKHVEQLTVICLEEGPHELPANIRVLSLGKEKGIGKIGRLWRLYKYIWQYRNDYDNVFVHMNQIYVILGWKLWWLLNKKTFLWYAHGAVPFTLRIAEKLVTGIFTSTPQGFRLPSKKVHVVGQGIDTEFFAPGDGQNIQKTKEYIVTVGRISRSKDYLTMIDALQRLKNLVHLRIIGGPITNDDRNYLKELQKAVEDKNVSDYVTFVGPLSNTNILEELQRALVFVNTGTTGSLDKAVLEAMSVGVPVVSSNDSVVVLLQHNPLLTFEVGDSTALAALLDALIESEESVQANIGMSLRNIVIKDHNLGSLIVKIIDRL